jgi:hypothetical protein
MLYTLWRWRSAFQNEFSARMDWCVKPFDQANHPPLAVCNGEKGIGTLMLKAKVGGQVAISAQGSRDPDGDQLKYRWWIYKDAGSYDGGIKMNGVDAERASLLIPEDAAGKIIHVILEVADSGSPSLTAYRRIIITVE